MMTDERKSDSQVAERTRVTAKLFFLATGLFFGLAVIHDAWEKLQQPPPIYGPVPEFVLRNQLGDTFGSSDLQSKVWVANFIFTRCKTVCPVFSQAMENLQTQTLKGSNPGDLQLVSFSVDPDFDTPEVLRTYSQNYNAKNGYWHFLTGSTDAVKDVVIRGLKVHMGDADKVEKPEALLHGSHFVLVGRNMNIRGYYPVDDEQTIDQILRDINKLTIETP